MQLPQPLLNATLLGREKRFLAHVRLEDGREVIAHCANPGAMRSCLPIGGPCRVSVRPEGSGRLGFSLQVVTVENTPVLVNTALPNTLVAEALAAGALPELGSGPWQRERPLPEGGRADFCQEGPPRRWLEVKAVSWALGQGWGAFPDAVTTRGARHLHHLAQRAQAGEPATLLFVVTRPDIQRLRPADELDPHFAQALRAAAERGVQLLARAIHFDKDTLTLGPRVSIELSSHLPMSKAPNPRYPG